MYYNYFNNKICILFQIFEEGTKAIPLSVDLWIHYINFYKTQQQEKENYYENVKK